MHIELLIGADDGKTAFMPFAEKAEWRTDINGSPGKLVCSILWDKALDISEGAPVRFKADGKNVFFGYVFSKEASVNGIIRLVCYDQIRYLLNKDTYIYENKTASQLIKLIAENFSVKVGNIEDSVYVIPYRVEENTTLLDMIENALELTYHNSGKRLVLYDDFGKLCLKSITSMYGSGECLLIGGNSGIELSFSSSVDKGAYSRVKLFYNNKKSGRREVYTSENKENAQRWGVLQYTASLKDGENGQAKAEELLKLYGGRNIRAEVKGAFGDPDFRAGCIGAVSPNIGIADKLCYMSAERVIHRFSSEGHFMDIVFSGLDLKRLGGMAVE